MKRQDAKGGHGRWWFLAVVAALYAVCAGLAPELALRGKGMRASTAAVFLYARAIKLPLLVHYFGSAYSVVLSLYLAGFALLSGFVMERIGRVEPA
jgi:hypothetical protein